MVLITLTIEAKDSLLFSFEAASRVKGGSSKCPSSGSTHTSSQAIENLATNQIPS